MIPSADGGTLLASLAGVAFLAGIMQSLLGFGYAITALAMLPFLLDARSSHLVVSLGGIPPLILAAYVYRQQAMLKPLLISLAGSCLLMPVGLLVFKYVPLTGLVRMTGCAILLFALAELLRPEGRPGGRISGRLCFLAGGLSGFLAGAVSIGGPPIVTFAMRQNWPPESFRFFVTVFLLVQALIKLAGLTAGGFLDGPVLKICAWSMPFTLAGVVIGTFLARSIDARRYRQLVAWALIVSATSLIWGRSGTGSDARNSDTRAQSRQFHLDESEAPSACTEGVRDQGPDKTAHRSLTSDR